MDGRDCYGPTKSLDEEFQSSSDFPSRLFVISIAIAHLCGDWQYYSIIIERSVQMRFISEFCKLNSPY